MIYILLLPQQELDVVTELYCYKHQIEELQAQVNYLEAENSSLRMTIRELQCRVDPYSPDGDAICNSPW
jgi:regulator of replication initiation timing